VQTWGQAHAHQVFTKTAKISVTFRVQNDLFSGMHFYTQMLKIGKTPRPSYFTPNVSIGPLEGGRGHPFPNSLISWLLPKIEVRWLCTPITPAATEWSPLLLRDVICSERVTVHFQWGGNLSLVILTFDLWPWHLNSSEQGTKHVFRVNFAQTLQWFPRYFIHKQQANKNVTDSATNRTLRSSLRAVKTPCPSYTQTARSRTMHCVVVEHTYSLMFRDSDGDISAAIAAQ